MAKQDNKKNYYIIGLVIAVCVVSIVIVLLMMPSFLNKSNPVSHELVNASNTVSSISNSTTLGSTTVNTTNSVSTTVNTTSSNTEVTRDVISQIYSTVQDGREWFSNWYTKSHLIDSGDFDPYDPEFQARGNGHVAINGDGTATLNGSAPRMYVYDPTLQKKWKNVEITIYAKRVSEQNQVSSQGITAGARSGSHDDVTYPDVCKDNTGYPNGAYNGRLTYDGRADYVKEVLYHKADSVSNDGSDNSPNSISAFSSFSTPIDPSTKLPTMPKNMWIGYKFVVQNINHDTAVKLETWMDLTNGQNGGDWKKINEYIDKGGWNATYFYKKNSEWPCPDISADNVMTYPMPYIFVRADAVNEIDYKDFSIREISPLP